MPDEFELARGWFLKAESDLNTAQRMVESDGPYDTACFHAQQITLSFLMLSLPVLGFTQAPASSLPAPAPQQPAPRTESAKPAPPASPAPAEQPTAVDDSQIVVPRDTLIPMVLLTTINTKSNFVGQAIFCKSIFPITVGNRIIIPEGSSIRGTVTRLIRPGRVKGRAKIGLRFDLLVLPNDTTRQLRASLAGFGSAGNERFNPQEGQIEGTRSKKDSTGVQIWDPTHAGGAALAMPPYKKGSCRHEQPPISDSR